MFFFSSRRVLPLCALRRFQKDWRRTNSLSSSSSSSSSSFEFLYQERYTTASEVVSRRRGYNGFTTVVLPHSEWLCALRKRATGGKSLFIGSQSPGTNPEKTQQQRRRQKSPFLLSERSSVSSFSRRRLDFYHAHSSKAQSRCAKSKLKRGLLLRYYGGVFLVRSQTLSLLKKVPHYVVL